MKHRVLRPLLALALALALTAPACAGETALARGEAYVFSQTDFEDCAGLLLTEVPEAGSLLLEGKALRAGDVVTAGRLSELAFVPGLTAEGEATVACLRLTEGGAEPWAMTFRLGRAKDLPPTAEDSEFETYKNVPGRVELTAADPEGEPLTVEILREPKRGDVTVAADGTVTYTPHENKVGRDSFTYAVSDPGGQTSEEATVRVAIRKPSDKQTYGDMAGDPAELAAVWLREEGIYVGETVSGQPLFGPDKIVTRGEFIAMCAGLSGLGTEEAVSTGFADEAAAPAWLSPYVTAALRGGYLSGTPSAAGLSLDADSAVTQAQAVKLVGGMLGLGAPDAQVMGTADGVPAWAASAAAAMASEGVYTVTDPDAPLTRREAALLLYAAHRRAEGRQSGLLAWAAK